MADKPTLTDPAAELSRIYNSVHFACQKCGNPLNIDTSYYDNNQLVELSKYTDSTSKIEDADSPPTLQPLDNTETFTILNDVSKDSSSDNMDQLKVQSKLFDILSETSSFDHPICEDCADNLLNLLDKQLHQSQSEYNDYSKFYLQIKNQQAQDESELDNELQKLTFQYEQLTCDLADIDNEHEQVKSKMEAAERESKQLKEDEKIYYENYNEYKLQLLKYNDSHMSVNRPYIFMSPRQIDVENQLKYSERELEKLKKTNVFNSTFHIWHNGHFGTINGYRLGRLPSIPVEWNEINTAWGQTALLLNSLATRMGLTFKRYKIRPLGNHSHMENLTEPSKVMPLYSTGGFKFLWDTKFDRAMVAFLDCLQQFKDEVEKGDTSFILPYKMDKGRIEDATTGQSYSIRIQFNCEEQWTKALKYTLTNLKWILAWVSSQFTN